MWYTHACIVQCWTAWRLVAWTGSNFLNGITGIQGYIKIAKPRGKVKKRENRHKEWHTIMSESYNNYNKTHSYWLWFLLNMFCYMLNTTSHIILVSIISNRCPWPTACGWSSGLQGMLPPPWSQSSTQVVLFWDYLKEERGQLAFPLPSFRSLCPSWAAKLH